MSLKFIISFFFFHSVSFFFAQSPGTFEELDNFSVHQFSKRIKKAKHPVLVCFGTDTSLVTVQQKNILNEVNNQYESNLDILFFDLKHNPKLAAYFDLDSVPVLILYVDAYPIWLVFGKLGKEELMKCLMIYGIKFKEQQQTHPSQASAALPGL